MENAYGMPFVKGSLEIRDKKYVNEFGKIP